MSSDATIKARERWMDHFAKQLKDSFKRQLKIIVRAITEAFAEIESEGGMPEPHKLQLISDMTQAITSVANSITRLMEMPAIDFSVVADVVKASKDLAQLELPEWMTGSKALVNTNVLEDMVSLFTLVSELDPGQFAANIQAAVDGLARLAGINLSGMGDLSSLLMSMRAFARDWSAHAQEFAVAATAFSAIRVDPSLNAAEGVLRELNTLYRYFAENPDPPGIPKQPGGDPIVTALNGLNTALDSAALSFEQVAAAMAGIAASISAGTSGGLSGDPVINGLYNGAATTVIVEAEVDVDMNVEVLPPDLTTRIVFPQQALDVIAELVRDNPTPAKISSTSIHTGRGRVRRP
jgi:hypothetical protein